MEHCKMVSEKSLTPETVNPRLLGIQYAVRGPIFDRALHIERELEKGVEKPFRQVVHANIGDCHALGQKPVTFIRQVLSVVTNPALLSSAEFPNDVKERARVLLADCSNSSVGAYSPAEGLSVVRAAVAQRLSARDGAPASPQDVYLGAGASDLIRAVLSMFVGEVDGKPPAVMIPIPQYPLFSGTLAELGVLQAGYHLEEGCGWALTPAALETSWQAASSSCSVRALVVINPGNPTGQVLTWENMEEVIKFAHRRNLFILADEVYQENIVSKPFHSFKKVMAAMGVPYSTMELASFMTLSKGWAAECGLRAGCVELLRLHPGLRSAFRAARALQQCPSVLGQCALHCVMKPPSSSDESYEQFSQEVRHIRRVLVDRTRTAFETFNSIPGYFCNKLDGSMFAFTRVDIPQRAREAGAQLHMAPDEFYCLLLLEETGVCVVPGSGFGQLPGTFHFRTTILHPREEFQHMIDSIRRFHHSFLLKYSDEGNPRTIVNRR